MDARDIKARSDRRSPGFFLLLLMTLTTGRVCAQSGANLSSLIFDGVTAISVNQLREEFSAKEGRIFAPDLLQADVQNLLSRYQKEGYVFCSAESVLKYDGDSSSVEVSILVHEGNTVVIGTVSIAGSISEGSFAQETIPGLHRGDLFSPASIESGIQFLLKDLERNGYPFAGATVERIDFKPGSKADSADLSLSLDAGPRILLTQIQVEGNTTTRSSVIEREARVAENQPFTEEVARTVKRRLERLRLFSSVSMPELFVNGKQDGGILLRVKEGNPNRFDGILGYVPSSAGQGGYVTGLIDLEFKNLFGTARSLTVRWIRENQNTQDLRVTYREPWIASIPLDGRVGFAQRKQDSTYLRRSYDFEASYSLSDEFSVGLSFQRSDVYPSERVNNPVSGSASSVLGGSLFYDTRENPENPTAGAFYKTSYETGHKSGSTEGGAAVTRLTFDLEYYVETVSRQVLALSLHGRDIASDVLEQSDLFRIGGTSTLRGYRESQFLCSRVAWMNIEYRFLPGFRSQVFAFIDGAYLALRDRPQTGLVGSEQSKAGYGVGARIDSGIGLLGFSIGLGEGDTFRTAKLHLRLINEF